MKKGWFSAICLILLLQATVSHLLSVSERDLPVPHLSQLPLQYGEWRSVDEQRLEPEIAAWLKPDDYIIRQYASPSGESLNLFVAYFKSLQNTYGPHSPRVCLPASGWLVRSWKVSKVKVPSWPEGEIPVNEYVLEKSGENILVLYWYQNNRHVWAQEFEAKLKMLPDLLRYRRSDVSLVRLVIPFRGTDWSQQFSTCSQFTRSIFPSLVERFGSVQ